MSPRTLRSRDNGGNVQIALTRRGRADVNRLIGHLHMLRGFIRV